jgi:hypothetical protein
MNEKLAWENIGPGEAARKGFGWYLQGCREEGLPVEFRTVMVVCNICRGKGTTWHGWGGRNGGPACSFSGDEWNDMHDDDREGYMDGTYDAPCPECLGHNVVECIVPESTPEGFLAGWHASLEEDARDRAVQAQEIAMGC